jgi:hypothetical protein
MKATDHTGERVCQQLDEVVSVHTSVALPSRCDGELSSSYNEIIATEYDYVESEQSSSSPNLETSSRR